MCLDVFLSQIVGAYKLMPFLYGILASMLIVDGSKTLGATEAKESEPE